MINKIDLEKQYRDYKDKKQQYGNILFLKTNKQKESIEKLLKSKDFLNEIGIEIDEQRLTDNEYIDSLLEQVNKVYLSLLTTTADLLS